MKYDPGFATSPICVTDKDYDFSVDPEIITLVESDPFYGYESEPVVDTPENPNDNSISDAETQSGDEHEPSDSVNDDVHVDAQPSNNNDVEIEPAVDLDIITLVESDPFYGYESETVVAHLTKLNDIATHEEKNLYYYILKLFPFSLKCDAKIWFNSLAPGCVHSPQDMIYYFSAKYFPTHKK